MSSLSQQASAVEAAIRVVQGTGKPTRAEKAFLAERLNEAAITLRRLEFEQRARV